MRGAGWVEACQVTGGHVEIDCEVWVQWGGWWQTKGHSRPATLCNVCYAEFTYGSCIRRCGAVVDIGCILRWQASTWGWSVVAGGSGRGASVPGGWRSEEPTTWTHAARPSYYLWLSTGLQWKGERGQTDCDEGGLVTDPDLGLSSGCCVGPELIEGES